MIFKAIFSCSYLDYLFLWHFSLSEKVVIKRVNYLLHLVHLRLVEYFNIFYEYVN